MTDMKLFSKIGINNFRALAIHGVIVFLSVVLAVALTFVLVSFSIESPLVVLLGILIVIGLYVLLAFCFLNPLFKYNLLSVSCLPILLVVLTGIHHIFFLGETNSPSLLVLATNAPSIFIALTLSEFVSSSGSFQYSYSRLDAVSILYIAAFIPSICMYAGLRLKIWRFGNKSVSESTNGGISEMKR